MKESNYLHSFAGKILRIKLSNGKFSSMPTEIYAKEWLGSSGIAIKLLFDELREWVTPYDPANKLIFGAGTLVGTTAPGASKSSMSTLGPVTGGWASGLSDSHTGWQLKCAGYDLIVIDGKSHIPVYLLIHDEKIEIRSAAHLWGLTTWDTVDRLKDELGDLNLHVVSIGPAGENMVRGACIIQDKSRAFGRCGTGAVMGSKNLKAIVVKGSGSIKVAHPQRFMTVAGKIRKKYEKAKTFQNFHRYGTLFNYDAKQENCGFPFKNFQSQCLPGELFNSINPHKMIDKFKVASKNYPGCPIGCGHILHINEGPYSGLIAQCNQMEVMGTIQTRLAVMEPTFMVMANAICNQLGLDVDAAGGAIGWAMECYQRGIIDEGDTDGLSLKWGNEDVILKLIKKIGYKDGFGELLAEGSSKASELIGRGSNYYAMHIKGQELYETLRGSIGWCLGTTTSTRGGGHTTGTVIDSRAGYDENDANKARQIYGITSPHLPLEYDGKAKMVLYMEALHRVSNSLGICHMNTIWWDIALMDIVDMAELYSAATGWETTDEDLKIIAMKQINLEKALNLRHTKFDRKDDLPTLRDFSEPIPEGKLSGWKLDENKFNKVLDEYYELHGWDKETSYPTRETLVNLGLKYVADELGKNGKIS